MPRVGPPLLTAKGEPGMGVSVPVLESRVNPAISRGSMLIKTNLPCGSTAMDEGWELVPNGVGAPTAARLPVESMV